MFAHLLLKVLIAGGPSDPLNVLKIIKSMLYLLDRHDLGFWTSIIFLQKLGFRYLSICLSLLCRTSLGQLGPDGSADVLLGEI